LLTIFKLKSKPNIAIHFFIVLKVKYIDTLKCRNCTYCILGDGEMVINNFIFFDHNILINLKYKNTSLKKNKQFLDVSNYMN